MRHILIPVLFSIACAAPSHDTRTTLPTAEALREWWPQPMTARVQLCVSRTGEVTDVWLAHSSGDPHFDHAVVVDASRWQLPAGRAACRPTAITYVP